MTINLALIFLVMIGLAFLLFWGITSLLVSSGMPLGFAIGATFLILAMSFALILQIGRNY